MWKQAINHSWVRILHNFFFNCTNIVLSPKSFASGIFMLMIDFEEPPWLEKSSDHHDSGLLKWQWIQHFPSRHFINSAHSAANIITQLYNRGHVEGNSAVWGKYFHVFQQKSMLVGVSETMAWVLSHLCPISCSIGVLMSTCRIRTDGRDFLR